MTRVNNKEETTCADQGQLSMCVKEEEQQDGCVRFVYWGVVIGLLADDKEVEGERP